jgi:hypothetical protein
MRVFVCLIAKDNREARANGKWGARLEPFKINEIQQDADAVFRNGVLEDEPVTASMIYGDVPQYSWESRRGLLPGYPAMAKVNRRHSGETQQCRHCIQMMMTMNYIRRRRQQIEIVNDRYRRGTKVSRNFSERRAVGNRRVPASEQSYPQIAHV